MHAAANIRTSLAHTCACIQAVGAGRLYLRCVELAWAPCPSPEGRPRPSGLAFRHLELSFKLGRRVCPRSAHLKRVGTEVVHVRADRVSIFPRTLWSPDGETIARVHCSAAMDPPSTPRGSSDCGAAYRYPCHRLVHILVPKLAAPHLLGWRLCIFYGPGKGL